MPFTKITSVGVYGAGNSVRSYFDIRLIGGIFYLEIIDSDSGQNTRTAKIAISPDRMVLMGEVMRDLGNGQALEDVVTKAAPQNNFNRISSCAV